MDTKSPVAAPSSVSIQIENDRFPPYIAISREIYELMRHWKFLQIVFAIILILAIATIVAISQTGKTYTQDEGYNLVASQLINAGKRPYLDFFYQQAPNYAYLNALWMRIFGQSWRTAHCLSAILTSLTMILVAFFVRKHTIKFPWIFSLLAMIPFVLNPQVLFFGTVAQPFAIGLFLGVLSFLFTLYGLNQSKTLLIFCAGFTTGLFVSSTFWGIPNALVLTAWIIIKSNGKRLYHLGFFAGGAILPFLPLIYLLSLSYRPVIFGVFEYQILHRSITDWGTAAMLSWKRNVLFQWLFSYNLVLVVPAFAAFFHPQTRKRPEVRLSGWMSIAIAIYLLIPHPTFPQYFIFLVPYLTVLAIAALQSIQSTVLRRVSILVFCAGFTFSLFSFARDLYRKPFSEWKVTDEVANKVNEAANPTDSLYAWEAIYFAANHLPPPGLENYFGATLNLPADLASRLHVIPASEIDRQLASRGFSTVVISAVDPRVEKLSLDRVYPHKQVFEKGSYRRYYIYSNEPIRNKESTH